MNNDKQKIFRRNINLSIVLLIVIVSSAASFYVGLRYANLGWINDLQNYTKIIMENEQLLIDQDTTITDLNNEINKLNEKISAFNLLNESYNDLKIEYNNFMIEYNELSLENEVLRQVIKDLKDHQLSDENYYNIIVGNMSFTLSQRYIVYFSGLYEDTATDESGILMASTVFDDTLISFSWSEQELEPNLHSTLDNAYDSLGLVLEYDMYLPVMIGDRDVLYSRFKTVLDNEYTYMNVATWYEDSDMKHYVCIIQNTVDDVTYSLFEFISGFKTIM